jgi:RNA polymerase sigma-70 factor (ECF subfamily)
LRTIAADPTLLTDDLRILTWNSTCNETMQRRLCMATAASNMNDFKEPEGKSHPDRIQEITDIISRRMPFFHRMALRHLGNMADAEDAVQDAILSAYKHLDQFKGEAQMSTWLGTIVINSARTLVRRRPRHLHISLDGQDGEMDLHQYLSDRRPGPEELCRRWELRHRLAQLSTSLSPTVRKTFQLREVEGLSIRETAEILGVERRVVKTRSATARAKLRRLAQKNSRINGARSTNHLGDATLTDANSEA